MLYRSTHLFLILLLLWACSSTTSEQSAESRETISSSYPTIGSIERLEAELDQLIPADAQLELLAEGFDWSEGPVWVASGNYLLFSDIPPNRIYKWKEGDSISLYLHPSGFSGEDFTGKEPGSNGLLIDSDGNLVLCQHGNRQVARMSASLDNPQAEYTKIVGEYEGKRLNSPNDAVFRSNGDLYFTDPPYGLPGGADSEEKELDFQGVYRFSAADSSLTLLTKELSRPNGIGLSPDEKTLYVANSDPERALWMAFDVLDNGDIDSGRVLYDATERVSQEKGLPDGMTVHSRGYIFATGPGGVWIFNAEGVHLGTLKTGQATANCTLNEDESALYITADMYLLRLPLNSL